MLKEKKRYAVCGLSQRAIDMYILPMLGETYAEYGEIVSILDIDLKRVQEFNASQNQQIQSYLPDDFDRMIDERQPHTIIVASPDATHTFYIIKALQHNLDILVEKPMVIDCAQAHDIIQAEKKSAGKLQVAFNFRYLPAHLKVKRLIKEGLLGRITNIEFVYNLDTCHGSSYFYRWNRDRKLSGGLSITKSCHHFDLINWWLEDIPQQVFAYGALNYYGANSPFNPSVRDGTDYSIAEQRKRCPFYQRWHQVTDIDKVIPEKRALDLSYDIQYPQNQPMYIYDQEITIEDTYSAVILYRNGTSMTYSANFSAAWEGYTLGINGTKGRLEVTYYPAPQRCPFPVARSQSIAFYSLFDGSEVYDIDQIAGKHGGADALLQHDIFVGATSQSLELGLTAGSKDGAYAVALGEAIWRSVQERRAVTIDELFLPD